MKANEFLEKVVNIYYRDNCHPDEAILKAKDELKINDKEFELIKQILKSKMLRRLESWNM